VRLAAWVLVLLLASLVTGSAAGYGVASASTAAYVLPILLAACALGLGAGLGLAGASAGIVWLLAWGERAGWVQPQLEPQSYHLTFNAPTLTLLFVLVALVSGTWSRHLVRHVQKDSLAPLVEH
jgi:hypothetical protein